MRITPLLAILLLCTVGASAQSASFAHRYRFTKADGTPAAVETFVFNEETTSGLQISAAGRFGRFPGAPPEPGEQFAFLGLLDASGEPQWAVQLDNERNEPDNNSGEGNVSLFPPIPSLLTDPGSSDCFLASLRKPGGTEEEPASSFHLGRYNATSLEAEFSFSLPIENVLTFPNFDDRGGAELIHGDGQEFSFLSSTPSGAVRFYNRYSLSGLDTLVDNLIRVQVTPFTNSDERIVDLFGVERVFIQNEDGSSSEMRTATFVPLRIDNSGELDESQKAFQIEGNFVRPSVVPLPNGDFVVAINSDSLHLFKIDQNQTVVWRSKIEEFSSQSMLLTSSGSLVLSGFRSTGLFSPVEDVILNVDTDTGDIASSLRIDSQTASTFRLVRAGSNLLAESFIPPPFLPSSSSQLLLYLTPELELITARELQTNDQAPTIDGVILAATDDFDQTREILVSGLTTNLVGFAFSTGRNFRTTEDCISLVETEILTSVPEITAVDFELLEVPVTVTTETLSSDFPPADLDLAHATLEKLPFCIAPEQLEVEILREGDSLQFTFQTEQGATYILECSDRLETFDSTGQTILGSGSESSFTVPLAGARKFYRIVQTEN